jgi:TPR repeat protein
MTAAHPAAMCQYGVCLLKGFGVRRNLVEADALFRQSGALGSALGLYYHARCLEFGEGVVQNEDDALRLYRIAADMGEPAAMTAVGMFAASGKRCEVNFSEAVRHFRQAADKGDGVGQFGLACCLLRGDGVPQDEAEAVRLFQDVFSRRAVMWEEHDGQLECVNSGPIEQVTAAADARAATGRGDQTLQLYRAVKSLKSTPSAAVKSLQELADKGQHGANFNLGMSFLNGIGAGEDHARAIQCLRRAAPWDYVRAMTAPRETTPSSLQRSIRPVRMTKKSVTVHHTRLVRAEGTRSYIWV